MEEDLLFSKESFKYQNFQFKIMSKETITFQKVVTYTLPELEWNSADAWYTNLEERLFNLNVQGSYSKGGIKINAGYSDHLS